MKKKTTLICFVKYPAVRWALNRIHEQKKGQNYCDDANQEHVEACNSNVCINSNDYHF